MPAAGAEGAAAAVPTVAAITTRTAPATAAPPLSAPRAPPPSAPRAPPPARPMTYDAAAPFFDPAPRALERPCHWLGDSRRAIGSAALSPTPPPHVPTMCRRAREPPLGRAIDASWSSQRRSLLSALAES